MIDINAIAESFADRYVRQIQAAATPPRPRKKLVANFPQAKSPAKFEPAKYSGLAYGGGDIRQPAFRFPVVIDCANATVAKPIQVLLKDHKSDRPLGQHKAVITATSMKLKDGSISVDNPYSREVVVAAKYGFPWQASVRGRWKSILLLRRGESRKVNGRRVNGPKFIAAGFVWRETTVTGLGADESGPEIKFRFGEHTTRKTRPVSPRNRSALADSNELAAICSEHGAFVLPDDVHQFDPRRVLSGVIAASDEPLDVDVDALSREVVPIFNTADRVCGFLPRDIHAFESFTPCAIAPSNS